MKNENKNMPPALEIINSRLDMLSGISELPIIWKIGKNMLVTTLLPEKHHRHCAPFCDCAKQVCGEHVCIYNDSIIISSIAQKKRGVFINVCHAGASELIIPLFYGDRYIATLMAGPFRSGNEDLSAVPEKLQSEFINLPAADENKIKCLANAVELLIVPMLPYLATQEMRSIVTPSSFFKNISPAVQNAMEYAEKNFRSEIKIEKAARECGMSVSKLQHTFKQHTQISYTEYLIRIRLAEARRLTLYTELPIGEIAAICRLTDQSRMTQLFKKYYGTTPAKCRKDNAAAEAKEKNKIF